MTLVGSGALTRRRPVHLCGDLYQVAGGDLTHPYDASAYLLLGPRPVLFDCGSVEGHSALVANLRRLGVEPGDLAAVYATHGHYDHVSGLAPLRELADVPLHLHPAEHEAVRSGDAVLTSARPLYDRAFPPLRVDGFEPHVRVIHTPGHSPGSVCFLLETGGHRVLLAGDTLWGGFHPALGSDIDAWRDSLDRLLLEDFDVMSFGHVVSHLVLDAHAKVAAARERLGVLYDPWFVPPFAACLNDRVQRLRPSTGAPNLLPCAVPSSSPSRSRLPSRPPPRLRPAGRSSWRRRSRRSRCRRRRSPRARR